ncbi:MAG: zf-TFIIB domain-containing protein [Dehalococcoidia bacterium]|jgi:Zn-finger nucleic acid-binding protein
MKCPVDKSVMMVLEHRRIEFDYCMKCSGVWLDYRELELLVSVLNSEGAHLSGAELLTHDKAEGIKAKRKCPICRRKMDKAWLGKGPKVLIDSCPQGDGLWFDAGELQKVLQEMIEPGTQASADVISFLGEAFHATHKEGVKKDAVK